MSIFVDEKYEIYIPTKVYRWFDGSLKCYIYYIAFNIAYAHAVGDIYYQ